MAEVAVTFPSPSRFLDRTPRKAPAPSKEKVTIKATLPKTSALNKRRPTKAKKAGGKIKAGVKPKQTKSRDGSSVVNAPSTPAGIPDEANSPATRSFGAQTPFEISTLPLKPHLTHASLAVYTPSFQSESSLKSPIQFAHFRTSSAGEPGLSRTQTPPDGETLEIAQYELPSLQPLQFSPRESPQQDEFVGPSKPLTIHPPMPADETSINLHVQTSSPSLFIPQCEHANDGDEVDEEVQATNDICARQPGYPSPSPSASYSSSSSDSCIGIFNAVNLQYEQSGLLHQLFDEQTCGILSIKDGPGENPWRTQIWPMALHEPALYYAIMSMTACHAAKQDASLKITGSQMQGLSMKLLRERLFAMRTDTAVATTLVLAFSESWLSHIHTGIMHLRGAREFILQGLQQQESACMNPEDLSRIKFLRSTWVYMDIIARLTAFHGEDPEDLDTIAVPVYGPDVMLHDIDPLMGCAATLFPSIGSVANLVRHVRRTSSNSRRIVSRAAGLKYVITKWKAPTAFKPPEDESLEIDHSQHTAEAYRWAILLYLCQAVPMICSEEPAVLAGRALDHLAAVPITSRSVIVHIFPLLAAGCEAVSEEDRCFVQERWTAMMTRMCIGNIDRCWDVVREVWRRRDAAALRHFTPVDAQLCSPQDDMQTEDFSVCDVANLSMGSKQGALSTSTALMPNFWSTDGMRKPLDDMIIPEMTVRGSLHWVAVMAEKKWEILLG
ncbi:MAG: hypothetical protein Q9217_000637 [Psora testacea]